MIKILPFNRIETHTADQAVPEQERSLTPTSSARAFSALRNIGIASAFARVDLLRCDGLLSFLRLGLLACGRVPVPDDL